MGDFEADTRVEPVPAEAGDAAAAARAARYRAHLSQDWEIWGPNGGYLAAIALRAAGHEAAIPRPATFAAHFLRVGRFAPVEIEVEVLRRGRRSESLRVGVAQEGRPLLEALVRTAAEGPGLVHRFGGPPESPPPEELPEPAQLRPEDAGPPFPFWRNLDTRVCEPERFTERFGERRPRDPVWREWYRFRPRPTFDDPFVDAGRSLLILDTMSWPAACQPHPDPGFQAPNLDVAVWFHEAAPDSEWLLSDHVSPVAGGGLMGATGRVWSRDGRLLASGGAQLMCVPVEQP